VRGSAATQRSDNFSRQLTTPGGFSVPIGRCRNPPIYDEAATRAYETEDLPKDVGIELVAARKKNCSRPHLGRAEYVCSQTRKYVETTFRLLAERIARSIHAVTPLGFDLKVFVTVLSYSILGSGDKPKSSGH
jgi:hypothetical protein